MEANLREFLMYYLEPGSATARAMSDATAISSSF